MNILSKNFLVFGAGAALLKSITSDKRQSGSNNAPIPDFKGVIEVKHAIPGRIRFFIPSLKNNETAKGILITEIGKIKYVKNISPNTITGSLLIVFQENLMSSQLLIAIIIKLLGLEEEISKERVPVLKGEIQMIKDCINMAIFNKSKGLVDGNSLIIFALLVSAAYKFYYGSGIKVGPTTCLMWALSYLK